MATKKATETSTKATTSGKTQIPTIMLSRELYSDISRLAAYNQIKKTGPTNDSTLLRAALAYLFDYLKFDATKIDIFDEPKPAYIKKCKEVHDPSSLQTGIRKTFSVKVEDFEAAETLAAYNKFHGICPKNISQVCRDAMLFYIDNLDYNFRSK